MTPERIAELTALCEKAKEMAPTYTEILLQPSIKDQTCTRVEECAYYDLSATRQLHNEIAASVESALPELLAELTRITREQQEERADWYRFGTFMSQFDLGDKDGGTDAVVDSWIEGITRLTRERDEAFNADERAISDVLFNWVDPPGSKYWGRERCDAKAAKIVSTIRALKKPATGQATGEK